MNGEEHASTLDPEENKLIIKLYEEICTNIRTSDDISFKLLGFVPLISGSGAAILTLGKIWTDVSSIAIIMISLVAAVVTFGLFKWELRNVQKCNWLIARAAELEKSWAKILSIKENMYQFHGWSD